MKKSNILKIALIPTLTIGTMAIAVSLTSCSSNDRIVFANFSGYMNPDVQDEINQKYNVQWDEYESNETIPTFLKNGTYDVAIATQYKAVELARDSYQNKINHNDKIEAIISPIDWNKFNLKAEDGSNLVSKDNATGLYNFEKIKPYFTEQTWSMLTAYDLDGDKNNFDANCKDNLLNWTIPYFSQTLSFGYRGQEIQELMKPNISFKDIFNYLKKPESLNTIFKNNKSMALIKDERTNYDLARLLDNKSIAIDNDFKVSTIEKLTNDYAVLDNAIKSAQGNIALEGDSNTILNQLAVQDINAAITYNGDLIYASNGGDYSTKLENENRLPNQNDFHVVTPTDTLVCFDGIVVSNKIPQNNVDNVYNVIKQISFPINGDKLINDPSVVNNSFPLDQNMNNPNINYLPFINFDYVYYNPVWNSFYQAIEMNGSNLVDDWQKPFFANIQAIQTNPNENPTNKPDGFYKNIEYPTNQVVSSNLNIANYAFINNSVKRQK